MFAAARPAVVVVTTPNAEHNVRYEGLAAGELRHHDHRFEWTRAEFARLGRRASPPATATPSRFAPIGPDDPEVGPPTQLAVFTRTEAA